VMIDRTGTAKIIDFGSTRVAGLAENALPLAHAELLGTLQYMAPEYFLGEGADERADLFSLGVIAYQMLSGRLPYGADVSRARTRAAQRRLSYQSVLADDREIPAWIDEVLRKAVHPDPQRRYAELSEFIYDLRHPSAAWLSRARPPLLERNAAAFWRAAALILAVALVVSLAR
ncbi:MAG TPA: protein kinase, partial [Steroidobacteraceae bacterium]|nr:protein kinase [Steroidobacteraceae bacterium]